MQNMGTARGTTPEEEEALPVFAEADKGGLPFLLAVYSKKGFYRARLRLEALSVTVQ